MMTNHMIATLALVTMVSASAVSDLATRRIPNALTLSGLVVALALRSVQGMEMIADGVLGAFAGLALCLPIVAVGGLGGGDAKLLSAVGAFLGLSTLPVALVVTALAGGIMAMAVILHRRVFRETIVHLGLVLRRVTPGGRREPLRTLATPGAVAVPYGVAIGTGALVGWWG